MAGEELLDVIRQMIEKMPARSPLELATVVSTDPLVIQLDWEANLQLEHGNGEFKYNSQIIFEEGMQLVVSRTAKPNIYIVLCALGGTLGEVSFGKRADAKIVLRQGDLPIITDGASAGTAHTHNITNATPAGKVRTV